VFDFFADPSFQVQPAPNRAPRLAPMASGALPGCVLRAGASYRHAGLAGVAHQALTLAAP